MSFGTGTNCELLYANTAAGTVTPAFTTERVLNDTAGMGAQAFLAPGLLWSPSPTSVGRGFHIKAQGVLSSTGTPTYLFNVRLGASGIAGPIVLGMAAAVTTGSGVANQPWMLEGDIILTAVGAGGAASTVRGQGWFKSTGIASPFMAGLGAGGSLTAPTVATVDTSITNYFNVTATCNTSNAANIMTLQQLMVWGLN